MDAQNAVESANTKQAASPKRGGVAESDDPKATVTANSSTTNNNVKPLTARPSFIVADPPVATTPSSAHDDDVGPDQNSDAETIVLPGKDGISPSKPRKVIKHEDKSDGEIDDVLPPPRKHLKDGKDSDRNGGRPDDVVMSLERKRRLFGKEKQSRNKDASSGLSSAPASPPPHRRNNHEQIHRRRRSGDAHSESGSESPKSRTSKDPIKTKSKSVERLLPSKRKADAEGHEPLEKVPDDLENAEEIRAALREAKERVGELRRTSEDHQPHDGADTVSSHGPESPRRSPTASGSGALAAQRRGGAVRSTKTSNHLLYMNLDDKTLRQAAARGDNETVTRVLQVKERCDDPEALVNAARGGHSFVVELLLALGGANPDPRPVSSLPTEYGTPMLAAIGGENLEVVKLLLNAANFDPTRRCKGQTYYEIARRREGPMWKEEEHLLKNAYDDYKKP
ncbi:hypothetical protein GGR54DRAFT_178893 [Hypoxylon sp. NC1633]|nr:hypothetical protein GGR54DRAFT_178893 [Hypoxylon sp. NC1633]